MYKKTNLKWRNAENLTFWHQDAILPLCNLIEEKCRNPEGMCDKLTWLRPIRKIFLSNYNWFLMAERYSRIRTHLNTQIKQTRSHPHYYSDTCRL